MQYSWDLRCTVNKQKMIPEMVNWVENKMLPKDIYHTIGLFLSFKDITNLMLCSKIHYRYMTRDEFWRRKLKMDYLYFVLSDDDIARELYTILSYNWGNMLKRTDNISSDVFENFETPLARSKFCYGNMTRAGRANERVRQLLAAVKKQFFHLDRQRI